MDRNVITEISCHVIYVHFFVLQVFPFRWQLQQIKSAASMCGEQMVLNIVKLPIMCPHTISSVVTQSERLKSCSQAWNVHHLAYLVFLSVYDKSKLFSICWNVLCLDALL